MNVTKRFDGSEKVNFFTWLIDAEITFLLSNYIRSDLLFLSNILQIFLRNILLKLQHTWVNFNQLQMILYFRPNIIKEQILSMKANLRILIIRNNCTLIQNFITHILSNFMTYKIGILDKEIELAVLMKCFLSHLHGSYIIVRLHQKFLCLPWQNVQKF